MVLCLGLVLSNPSAPAQTLTNTQNGDTNVKKNSPKGTSKMSFTALTFDGLPQFLDTMMLRKSDVPQRLPVSSDLRNRKEMIYYEKDESTCKHGRCRIHCVRWDLVVRSSDHDEGGISKCHWSLYEVSPKVLASFQPRLLPMTSSQRTYITLSHSFYLCISEHVKMVLICPRIHFYEINDQAWYL